MAAESFRSCLTGSTADSNSATQRYRLVAFAGHHNRLAQSEMTCRVRKVPLEQFGIAELTVPDPDTFRDGNIGNPPWEMIGRAVKHFRIICSESEEDFVDIPRRRSLVQNCILLALPRIERTSKLVRLPAVRPVTSPACCPGKKAPGRFRTSEVIHRLESSIGTEREQRLDLDSRDIVDMPSSEKGHNGKNSALRAQPLA